MIPTIAVRTAVVTRPSSVNRSRQSSQRSPSKHFCSSLCLQASGSPLAPVYDSLQHRKIPFNSGGGQKKTNCTPVSTTVITGIARLLADINLCVRSIKSRDALKRPSRLSNCENVPRPTLKTLRYDQLSFTGNFFRKRAKKPVEFETRFIFFFAGFLPSLRVTFPAEKCPCGIEPD